MTQWFSRHWTAGNKTQWTLKEEKKIKWTCNCPPLLLREVLRMWKKKEKLAGTSIIPELKRHSWESEETKMGRVCIGEYWKEQGLMRSPWDQQITHHKSLTECWTTFMYQEITWGPLRSGWWGYPMRLDQRSYITKKQSLVP